MIELRNVEADLIRFRARVLVITGLVCVSFLILLLRLGYLQVLRHAEMQEQAELNRTTIVPLILPCQDRLPEVIPTQKKPRKKGTAEGA